MIGECSPTEAEISGGCVIHSQWVLAGGERRVLLPRATLRTICHRTRPACDRGCTGAGGGVTDGRERSAVCYSYYFRNFDYPSARTRRWAKKIPRGQAREGMKGVMRIPASCVWEPSMSTLSDELTAAVERYAAPLTLCDLQPFIDEVCNELASLSEVGPGVIARIVRHIQPRYIDQRVIGTGPRSPPAPKYAGLIGC